MSGLLVWFRAMRPAQWAKNAVVPVAWFFACADISQRAHAASWEALLLVLGMTVSFCFVSSGFYLLNDVCDCDADRLHPIKCRRPVAAGLIEKAAAVRVALVLLAIAFLLPAGVAWQCKRFLALEVILAYAIVQCAYTGGLKRLPYVDVFVIAFGFVLRGVAGAAIIDVRISPWLLACTFVLSLFLALCKRRHEKVLAGVATHAFRHALTGYHRLGLDVLIGVSAVATVGCYLAYTLASDTIARFGHAMGLPFTSIFVAAGVVRYLVLVYCHAAGGRPEKVLLTDKILWCILCGYGMAVGLSVFVLNSR